MKYIKRMLLMAAISAVAVCIMLLLPMNQRENMTFVLLSDDGYTLYEMKDDLVAVPILNTENKIVMEDGVAAYFEYEDAGHFNWSLVTVDLSTGQKRCIANGENNNEHKVHAQFLCISDGTVYYPYFVLDYEKIIDTHVVEAKLDGSGGRIFTDLKINGFGIFDALDGKLFYMEQETAKPVIFDLQTEVEEYLSEEPATFCYEVTWLEKDRFWYLTTDGDLTAYYRGEALGEIHFYVTGVSHKNGNTKKVLFPYSPERHDLNYWINDGYLYTFRDGRQEERWVADLYRMNLNTQQETCIAEGLIYDQNFPPSLSFGNRGIVVKDTIGTENGYEEIVYYVNYDGSGIEDITFSE